MRGRRAARGCARRSGAQRRTDAHSSPTTPSLPSPPLPADRRRVEANGSYAKRKHIETDDNPLYRLPEQPSGSQRLDGLSQWNARAQQYQHH